MRTPLLTALLLLTLLPGESLRATERHGGDFLRVEPGADAVARGGTGLLLAAPALAGWWNPALLAGLEGRHLGLQHSERFAGALVQDLIAYSGPLPGLEALGPLGLTLLRQGVEDIPLSDRLEGGATLEEGGRPWVREHADAADWILGLAWGRSLRPNLDGGVGLKLIHRDLVSVRANGLGLDAGLRWRPLPRWQAGLMLRDAAGTLLFWSDGQQDWIPPEWSLGLAWEPPWPRGIASLQLELDLKGELEGRVPDSAGRWRRAWLQGGLEWRLLERLALRAGRGEGDWTAGAGLLFARFAVDYAWRPHPELGDSHLVSLAARLP
jgi:hypothetical protein